MNGQVVFNEVFSVPDLKRHHTRLFVDRSIWGVDNIESTMFIKYGNALLGSETYLNWVSSFVASISSGITITGINHKISHSTSCGYNFDVWYQLGKYTALDIDISKEVSLDIGGMTFELKASIENYDRVRVEISPVINK
jgi:hypothetical protein